MDELVEVFDRHGNPKDYIKKRFEPFRNSEYSKVIHIWIKDGSKYLVQQRSITKKVDPLNWSMTSGTKEVNESLITTALRELKEEIGLTVNSDELIFIGELIPVIDNDPLNNHLASIFLINKKIDLDKLVYQYSEVKTCDLWSKEQIIAAVNKGEFTDFSIRYPNYFNYIFDRSESL